MEVDREWGQCYTQLFNRRRLRQWGGIRRYFIVCWCPRRQFKCGEKQSGPYSKAARLKLRVVDGPTRRVHGFSRRSIVDALREIYVDNETKSHLFSGRIYRSSCKPPVHPPIHWPRLGYFQVFPHLISPKHILGATNAPPPTDPHYLNWMPQRAAAAVPNPKWNRPSDIDHELGRSLLTRR